MQCPQIDPLSLIFTASEMARPLAELSSSIVALPILSDANTGDGHPVMVLPGFTAGDGATLVLRRYLQSRGYDVHGWNLGANYGQRSIGVWGELLARQIEAITQAAGQKVSLVGWSLGGIMARDAARKNPQMVRQVISLGSPFTADPRAAKAWRFFERVTAGKTDSSSARRARHAAPPPVPCTAIHSKTDGIVPWKNCLEQKAELTDNIEVCSSHWGLVVNPAVLCAIADRLAQPEGDWKPFDRSGWRAAFYPSSGHAH